MLVLLFTKEEIATALLFTAITDYWYSGFRFGVQWTLFGFEVQWTLFGFWSTVDAFWFQPKSVHMPPYMTAKEAPPFCYSGRSGRPWTLWTLFGDAPSWIFRKPLHFHLLATGLSHSSAAWSKIIFTISGLICNSITHARESSSHWSPVVQSSIFRKQQLLKNAYDEPF